MLFFFFWFIFKWIFYRKSGRPAINKIKILFFQPQLVASYHAAAGTMTHRHRLDLPRLQPPSHHKACFYAAVCVQAFVMGSCCPQGNNPSPSQMHTRVCKLKRNPGLRHRKVIFKCKWHMLQSKHQVLAFVLLLQLNTYGQNLKGARAGRLNPWNFQSDNV